MIGKIRRFYHYLLGLSIRRTYARQAPRYQGQFDRELWELSDDLIGIKSKQYRLCPYCASVDSKNSIMLVRKSILVRSEELEYRNAVIDLYYKCPRCALVLCFGIAVPNEHFVNVVQRRMAKGIKDPRIYAPVEAWKNVEIVKKRLEQLGYF